ncbi:MAG: hypothetical protein ACTHN5_19765 [Phycisphaerae bacterium]
MRKIFLITCAVVMAGCSSANVTTANNRLRAQAQKNEAEIATLKGKVASDEQLIASLREQVSSKTPAVQTLPAERLRELFTVGSVEIQKGTDASDLGTGDGKSKGFRLFFRTLTGDGMVFPATGTLEVEAFWLPKAPAEPVRIGAWTFTPEEMKKNWYSGLGLNHFAFNLPWEKGPGGGPGQSDVTFKATFTDALTGNVFTAHLDKKVTVR